MATLDKVKLGSARHEMSYDTVGEYDKKTKSYSIIRMPLPPNGRVRIVESENRREFTEIAEIKVACPHCLVDVELGFVVKKATRGAIQDLQTRVEREVDRVYGNLAKQMHAVSAKAYADQWIDNWLETSEEFNS